MPSEELLAAMGKYNEELQKAGVLLDLTGLQPTSKGARVDSPEASAPWWTALHGIEGADRRVLADPSEVPGGGDRVGEARPRSPRRGQGQRDRDPAALRARRLRPERGDRPGARAREGAREEEVKPLKRGAGRAVGGRRPTSLSRLRDDADVGPRSLPPRWYCFFASSSETRATLDYPMIGVLSDRGREAWCWAASTSQGRSRRRHLRAKSSSSSRIDEVKLDLRLSDDDGRELVVVSAA